MNCKTQKWTMLNLSKVLKMYFQVRLRKNVVENIVSIYWYQYYNGIIHCTAMSRNFLLNDIPSTTKTNKNSPNLLFLQWRYEEDLLSVPELLQLMSSSSAFFPVPWRGQCQCLLYVTLKVQYYWWSIINFLFIIVVSATAESIMATCWIKYRLLLKC